MIGIQLHIPNECGQYLNQILAGLIQKTSYWLINDTEIIVKDECFSPLFPQNFYNGDDFKNIISTQEYYIVRAKIQCFYSKDDVEELISYEDYQCRSSQLVLFIDDSDKVCVLAKNVNWLLKILKHAPQKTVKNIRLIGEDELDEIKTLFSQHTQGYTY